MSLRVVTVLAGCALACSCGGSGSKPSVATRVPTATAVRATAPEPLDRCESAGAGWQALETSGADGPPSAARLGSGKVWVVFANDSNNDACDWSREAQALADHGYAVAVFDASIAYESRQAWPGSWRCRPSGASTPTRTICSRSGGRSGCPC